MADQPPAPDPKVEAEVEVAPEEEGMNDAAYNTFNAPQFLDFSQLVDGDDAEADKFFATHKEEDDFFTPSETLVSPSAANDVTNSETLVSESAGDEPNKTKDGDKVDNEVIGNEEVAAQAETQETGETSGATDSKNTNPEFPEATTDDAGPNTNSDNENVLEKVEEVAVATVDNEKVMNDQEEPEPDSEELGDKDGVNEGTDAIETLNIEAEVHGTVTAVVESDNTKEDEMNPADQTTGELQTEESQPEAAVKLEKAKSDLLVLNHEKKKAAGPAFPKKKEFKMTVPQPFKLHQGRSKDNLAKPAEYKFKANPVPTKILQNRPPEKVKTNAKVTQPIAMHFKSDERIRERNEKKESVPQASTSEDKISKTSVHSSTNSLPKRPPTPKKVLPTASPTKVKPFSFDERNKELQRKKQLKLQEKLEKEVQTFKFVANPVPSFPNKQIKLRKPVAESSTSTKIVNGKAGPSKENKNLIGKGKPVMVKVKPKQNGDTSGNLSNGNETDEQNGNHQANVDQVSSSQEQIAQNGLNGNTEESEVC
jgi:hypothetical protein